MTLDRAWRTFATVLSFFVFGVACLVLLSWLPLALALPFYWGRTRRNRLTRLAVNWWFLKFLHFMKFLGLCTWELKGVEKLNRPGQMIIANHPMFLDIMFMLAVLPQATCVIKGKVKRNPFLLLPVWGAGYIVNENSGSMIAGGCEALERGENFIIFPEGTRTRLGKPVTFQRGAANIAVKSARALTPVVIDCKPPTLTKEMPWYRAPERPWHFTMVVKDDVPLEGFRAAGEAPVASRRLNEHLQNYYSRELKANGRPDPADEAVADRVLES